MVEYGMVEYGSLEGRMVQGLEYSLNMVLRPLNASLPPAHSTWSAVGAFSGHGSLGWRHGVPAGYHTAAG